MPVGQNAGLRRRREVSVQPRHLRGAGARADVAVERDDVPFTNVIAVVAFVGVASGRTEVAEVSRRSGRHVLFVARYRPRASLVSPPAWVIARVEVAAATIGIHVISEGD